MKNNLNSKLIILIMNKEEFKPVIIGSTAVNFYIPGIITDSSDIDLIITRTHADDLISKSTKQEGGIIWFGDTKVDLLIEKNKETNTNLMILELCNEHFGEKTVILSENLKSIGEVILPPLEILYAIYKSHIHRIIPYTNYQSNNIEIWDKHVRTYEKIRQHLGYKKMDQIIYGGYGTYLDPLSNENNNETLLDHLTRKIFLARFEDTNQRVGDTKLSMEKTEEDFFNDNVKRYIEHDELHGLVGLHCRNDKKPLFVKYQKNEGTVDLDRKTFIQATLQEQIQIIVEEIMVLLLERKWIPELVKCYKEKNMIYDGFNLEKKQKELFEITAHFITNLCGQGHYFLRRFCLDHYKMIADLRIYDFDGLEKIALGVANLEKITATASTIDILNQIKNNDGSVRKYFNDAKIEYNYDSDDSDNSDDDQHDSKSETFGEDLFFGGNNLNKEAFIFKNENRIFSVIMGAKSLGINLPSFVGSKIKNYDKKIHINDEYDSILKFKCFSIVKEKNRYWGEYEDKIEYKTKPHIFRLKKEYLTPVLQFFNLFSKDDEILLIKYKYHYHDFNKSNVGLDFSIFNITKNVGIKYDWYGGQWTVFTCSIKYSGNNSSNSTEDDDNSTDSSNNKEVEISGIYVNIDQDYLNNAGNINYVKKINVYYYSSEDSSDCGWTDEYEITEKYLSSYGSFNGPFEDMEEIFEKVARKKLNIVRDIENRKLI